jgi:hypothetical protein
LYNQGLKDKIMQYIRDDKKMEGLWETWHFVGEKRRRLLEGSWAEVFRRFLLEDLPVGDLSDCFKENVGRPSKELYTMLGVLVLQHVHDMTDEEVSRALAFDMMWHYALDLRGESDAEKYVTGRTVRKYRRMALEKDLDEMLFEKLTDKLLKAFGVNADKQRLDSTHILSNMKNLSRVVLLFRVIERFLKNLKRHHPQYFESLEERGLREKYLKKNSERYFGEVKPSESRKTLKELAEDLFWLVERFKADKSVCGMQSYKQLCRVLSDQCEVVSKEDSDEPTVQVRKPEDVPSDCLQNPSDEEAAYDAHKGVGYQIQVQETFNEDDDAGEKPNLLTYIKAEPANRSDANAVAEPLEELQQRGCQPKQLLADSAYGSDENVERAKEAGVELISPTNPGSSKSDKLSSSDFEYDETIGEMTACPACVKPVERHKTPKGGLLVHFDRETCMKCDKRDRCPVTIGKMAATFRIENGKKLRLAIRRSKEKSEEFREVYRHRAGVEATMSRYKSQTGVGRLRVRGLRAVSYVAKMKGLGLNISRCGKALAARARNQRARERAVFGFLGPVLAFIESIFIPIQLRMRFRAFRLASAA